MTAVLSATDALRRDPIMSIDDSHISYSTSVDWRAKYNEVADMLAETRAELEDFQHASKELEAELENELQRTEKAQQDLRVKVARAETEKDDWKNKFMSLQTTHNTTTTSLQRELDKLRQEYQQLKVQLRELEMGNDDLERTERAVSSHLADVEAKYSKALEEKILLEHELLDKANVEEQCQRLKDELRDANAEVSILKDQLATRPMPPSRESTFSNEHSPFPTSNGGDQSNDDLLSTPAPADLQLADLSSDSLPESNNDEEATPRKPSIPRPGSQSPTKLPLKIHTTPTSIPRSNTHPSLYSSSPRTPITTRPIMARNPSTMSTNSTTSTASKSKGVQMVSEMRARVRNLEQKIHTRVPRLRMGSTTTRPNANTLAISSIGSPSPVQSSSKAMLGRSNWDTVRRSTESKRSTDTESEKSKKDSGGDSSGWVLIMEDSPSPPDRDRRRVSSPRAGYKQAASTSSTATSSPSPTFGSSRALSQSTMHSGIRRPQSRLSGGSTTTTSSVFSSTSRPATPTFLPIPSNGVHSGAKRSTGPGGVHLYASQAKRSSLGASTAAKSNGRLTPENGKALPDLPGLHTNITMRSSKLPPSTSSSLAQSRIGRPSGGARRKSADGSGDNTLRSSSRPRAGSATNNIGKSVF
ncbi:NADH:ubiquinone oxidoreductase [Stygiomarasmius scandens]|uniref:NADH:ubiquinone oxidoreductase n=1 Tax=Marasmiellus scandens TaxID=2682957 RepID=A0ABR1JLK8_9AGAR